MAKSVFDTDDFSELGEQSKTKLKTKPIITDSGIIDFGRSQYMSHWCILSLCRITSTSTNYR